METPSWHQSCLSIMTIMMPLRATLFTLLILLCVSALSACAVGATRDETESLLCRGDARIQPTIVNGRPQPRCPLSPWQQMAIGEVDNSFGTCTGTLIHPCWVLTAKHCKSVTRANDDGIIISREEIPDSFFTFKLDFAGSGLFPESSAPAYAVDRIYQHPEKASDLMLMKLKRCVSDDLPNIQPLGLSTTQPLGEWGTNLRPIEAAGLGSKRPSNNSDVVRFVPAENRLFVDLRVWDVGTQYVTTWGQGRAGVCGGDSGGPLLMQDSDGMCRIMGVLLGSPLLRNGEAQDDCTNIDRFSRVDSHAFDGQGLHIQSWIQETVGGTIGEDRSCRDPNASIPGNENSTLQSYNACVNGSLISCEGNQRNVQQCAAGEVCGWDLNSTRYACVPPSQDGCDGLTSRGVCEGNVARWCELGRIKERDCSSCQQTCMMAKDIGGVDCRPNDCGNLTANGRCNKNVLEWCDDGLKRSVSCSLLKNTQIVDGKQVRRNSICRESLGEPGRFACYPP